MNKFSSLLIIASLAFGLNACKEVGPDIDLGRGKATVQDTTYIESPIATPEAKNVVIEEFTGVRCPNCPQGHQIIASIKAAHPDNVVSMSLHPSNSLGYPYTFSTENFITAEAQNLYEYLGLLGLEPCAAIDRHLFSGESNVLLDKSKWTGYVNQQLATTTPVNIVLNKSYDTATRELTVIAEVHYTQTITNDNKLTIALVESGMVSAQLNGSVIDTFYTHNDIQRAFITDTKGDAITSTTEAGRVVRRVYKKTLDALWKPENMKIIAYVHEYQNDIKVVYQGKELEVQ